MEDFEDFDEDRSVARPDEINWSSLSAALASLQLFDDPYMRMQATNLGIVDQFLTQVEFGVLQENFKDDPDRSGLMFLNAQTQMWMFSAYELLRTWRSRVNEAAKLLDDGTLQKRIDSLLEDQGFSHFGMQIRAEQLRRLQNSPDSRRLIDEDLRLTHILFKQLDYLRVALAKHEVKGRKRSVALAPGYARMDTWSGSLQYELEAGQLSLGTLSRRNVADGIRAFSDRSDVPTREHLAAFDEFMKAEMPEAFRNRTP